MLNRIVTFNISLIFGLLFGSQTAHAQTEKDTENGAKLFVVCQSCHTISPTAKSLFGPSLHGLFGRQAGTVAGYQYSQAMREAGEKGLVWTDETLSEFLAHPRTTIPGTMMALEGFAGEKDRHDLINYLKLVYSPAGPVVSIRDDPPVPPEVMELTPDTEYGEYLASECMTCHQADGTNDGIPRITGWPALRFVMVMRSYKQKVRLNPVMQTIAGALGDQEIVSLADYLEDLD